MTAGMARRIEISKVALVMMSAPKLKPEPLRPPLRPATATIAEILAAKGTAYVS